MPNLLMPQVAARAHTYCISTQLVGASHLPRICTNLRQSHPHSYRSNWTLPALVAEQIWCTLYRLPSRLPCWTSLIWYGGGPTLH